MDDTKYRGQVLNFYELVKSKKIEIPIIQRDYAQGRKDKKKIRLNFLNALLESLNHNQEIMLDFIYGSNNEVAFQPLDGQQRLTTLFLLHWYAALKDGCLQKEKETLKGFSYETRISSRDFCHSLVTNSISLSKETKPSLLIIDSPWFYLSWKNDPTIDAMLRTIDDIHELFFDTEKLWEKLTSKELGLIRFYHVELEHIGLTDDLYIKMNARGKLLSTFENFKAGFEKYIKDNDWESSSNILELFANRVDTIWTDLFWRNFKKNNSVDDSFINFFSTLLMVSKSVERTSSERQQLISKLQEDSNNITPKDYSLNDFQYLINCLETVTVKFQQINNATLNFPIFRHEPKESLLSTITTDNEASYTHKVLLFSQLEYFRKVSEFNLESYQNWMRVVRNIVCRGDVEKNGKRPDLIRSPASFDGTVYLISQLSQGCDDIYNHLSNLSSLSSTFAKEQIEEEKLKAKIIINNPEIKEIIFELENTDLLRGRIGFIFYCLNINANNPGVSITALEHIKNIFIKNLGSSDCLNNRLRRALLTISVNGQFEFYNYWKSFWNVVDANKRKLLDSFREIEYLLYSEEYREYFKILIERLKDKDLEQIAQDFIPPENFPNWKLRLIKENEILDSNNCNYIAIPSDQSHCYILKSTRPRDADGCDKIE